MEHTATEERTAMEERLKSFLDRVSDWLKYEEAKNAALVALNGVAVGVVLQMTTSAGTLSSYVLSGCLLLFLISLLIGLASFYPRLDTGRLHQRATERHDATATKRKKAKSEWKPNVVFFRDIAGCDEEDYLDDLRVAADEDPVESTRLERDYATEIIANAELTLWKIRRFKDAFRVTAIGVVALAVAIFVSRLPAR